MTRYIFVLVAILSVACAAKLDWRIIGGSRAEDGQFPYQVSLQTLSQHICGGIILNEQWVLTSGHCVADNIATHVTVFTGTNKLDEGGRPYRVVQLIVHEDYDWYSLKNDIALVKIKGQIEFNEKVQPIPLETSEVPADTDVILSGWGDTSFPTEESPNDLHFLHLKTISLEECNSRIVDPRRGDVDSSQLCTLTTRGEGACHGDTGGPLTHNGRVAGIMSWGQPCAAGYPDVFTRVASFVGWINETMTE